MAFNLNATPDENNVREAITQGEGQQIELRERISSGLDLAKLVSGFANAKGGWIIVGVKEPSIVVGIDDKFNGYFDRVNQRTTPAQNLMSYPVTLNGLPVRVVVVKPFDTLVVTDAGAYIRNGSNTEPMQRPQVLDRKQQTPEPERDEQSATQIARLTETVDELMKKFTDSQSWSGQGKNLVVGAAGSTISTIIVTIIVLLFGIFIGFFVKR